MSSVLDLYAKILLDDSEYTKGLDDAESKAGGFGSKIGSALSGAAKIGTAALGGMAVAAGTATVALTQQATSAYAEYEQLAGGIDTLFGTGGQSLEEFAATAKATSKDIENSGIDWSKYSDTHWMSEGGGIAGLFDEMQYNFEELGTSAEELQEYLHFEYDMDMEDAKAAVEAYQNALTDESINAKYQSMVGAQEAMMENASRAFETAGMSANEYMETAIQSSAAMINSLDGDTAKAAELMDMSITDMADNVNKMGTSMESIQNAYRGFSRGNFTMLDNLALGYSGTKEGMEELLADAQAFSGVEYDIDSYADIVEAIHVVQEEMGITGTTANEASETIQGSAGSMQAAWQNLITGLANENADLEKLFDNFINSAVTALTKNIIPRVQKALLGISSAVRTALPKVLEIIPGLVEQILPDLIATITEMVTSVMQSLSDNLETITSVIMDVLMMIVDVVLNNLPLLLDMVINVVTQVITKLAEMAPELVPVIIDAVLLIAQTLMDNAPLLLQAAIVLIAQLTLGLVQAIPSLVEKLPEIIKSIVSTLTTLAVQLLASGAELLLQIAVGLVSAIPQLIEEIPDIITGMIEGFADGIARFVDIGGQFIAGLWEGISSGATELYDNVAGFCDDLATEVANFFGIHSPSRLFAGIGKNLDAGLAEGIEDNLGMVEDSMGAMLDTVEDVEPSVSVNAAGVSNVAGAGAGGNIVIPVYIGQEHLQTLVLDAIDVANYRSGGR